MKFIGNGARRGGSRGSNAKRLLSCSDDDDDVLLPHNGQVSVAGAFLSQAELKYYDTWVDFQAPGGSAVFSDSNMTAIAGSGKVICNPGQGDGVSARNGNRILVKSLHVKGSVRVEAKDDGTLILQPRRVHVAVVRDSQTAGASHTGFPVWVNPSGSTQQLMNVHRNLNFGDRFAVLRQTQLDMTPSTFEVLDIAVPDQTATSGRLECFEFFIPLDDIVVFKSNAADISAVENISYWLHAFQYPFGGAPGVITPGMEINYSARVRYFSAAM